MKADWSTLSEPQMRCIDALDFSVPIHHTHLTRRYAVRGPTIASLVHKDLVRRVSMFEKTSSIPLPFYTLTRAGLAYQRDWRRWNASVQRKVAEIFA